MASKARVVPVVPAVALAAALAVAGMLGPAGCGPGGRGEAARGPRGAWPSGRANGYANPIPAENARPGDPTLRRGRQSNAHQLEAYADHAAVRAGQVLQVKANVDSPHPVRWQLFRIGWYGGAGARLHAEGGWTGVNPQPPCPPGRDDGLVRCAWATAFTVPIDEGHVSGHWVVKLVRDDGYYTLAPFVVVDDRPADLLVQASVNTWQAYNTWGGESLYQDGSGRVPGGFALRVSFDRPYAANDGLGPADDQEFPFARFLERNGYDATYTTALEVARGGAARLVRSGAFLSIGHDEYWAGENRDAVEAARDAGVPVLFFGANVGYWKVRAEAAGPDGEPRVLTCYKSSKVTDPVTGAATTGRFRDPAVNRPENALVGVAYASWQLLSFPLVVAQPESWLFDGTGLAAGDALPGLVGNEFDVASGDAFEPRGLEVLARSPVLDAEGRAHAAATAAYRAPGGALVFAAGTIQWARGLDPRRPAWDPRLGRMTANVFHEALGLPVPPEVAAASREAGAALRVEPQGAPARSVTTVARGTAGATGVAALPDGSLAVVDPDRHQVLRIDAGGGISVLAGDGKPGRSAANDNVPGARARFFSPTAILALPGGALLVADTGNHCLRRIDAGPDHVVTTVAGALGQPGLVDGSGAAARFAFPMGLARDPASGAVYIADSANHRVRLLAPDGRVGTVAGSTFGDADGPGAVARLAYPTAVATGPRGEVYVVSSAGATVKEIAADGLRTVTTLAGGEGVADGPAAVARLGPQGGAVFAGGRLIFADPGSYRVRVLVPGPGPIRVETLAGVGSPGDTDGPGESARFALPVGLALASDGSVLVADPGNGSVRSLVP